MSKKKPDPNDLSFLDEPSTMTPPPEEIRLTIKPEPVSEPVFNPAPPAIVKAAPAPAPIVQAAAPKPAVKFNGRHFAFDDLDGATRWAGVLSKSGAISRSTLAGCQSEAEALARIVVIFERGMSLGLSPSQALESITMIQGRLALWGDAMVGLVLSHADCEGITDEWSGEGDARKVAVTAYRRGRKVSASTFGVADAKRAGLWGKSGPWTQYPDRMLLIRARTLAIRNTWADVTTGLTSVEDLMDYPTNTGTEAGRAAADEAMARLAR